MLARRSRGVPPALHALPASHLNDHRLPLFVITVWDTPVSQHTGLPATDCPCVPKSPGQRAEVVRAGRAPYLS